MITYWHRDDLRLHDNTALSHAAEHQRETSGEDSQCVRPVFVFDPHVLKHASDVRVAYLLETLRKLQERYRELGATLRLKRGDPADVLYEMTEAEDTVVWNEGYTPIARRRQDEVEKTFTDSEVEAREYTDSVLHHPEGIESQAGDPYSVFSYYHDSWLEKEKPGAQREPGEEVFVEDGDGDAMPSPEELGFQTPESELPPAGEQAALDRLDEYCNEGIYRYAEDRDRPDRDSTSKLSPYLSLGSLGVRELWQQTEEAKSNAEDDVEVEGVEELQRQLCFREFYRQLLYHHPETLWESYRAEPRWREAPEEVKRWMKGETGYPFVDAGMRQLEEEAWMHNRARMVAASFLTKHLLVDWRVGLDWFRQRLVDHDTANDVAGWQWAASTGVDAQPYFRVFNPISQCRDHDPDAEYVHRYVPELREVAAEDVHKLPEMTDAERAEVATDYFDPVVEHPVGRERALEAFEEAREDG